MTLSEYRESTGATQTDLANLFGVTRETYCRWENRRMFPSREMTTKIERLTENKVTRKDLW